MIRFQKYDPSKLLLLGSGSITVIVLGFAVVSGIFEPKAGVSSGNTAGVTYRDASHALNHATWYSAIDAITAVGVCIFDVNNDGWQDLFIPGLGAFNNEKQKLSGYRLGNALFLNYGLDESGLPIFEDVTERAGVSNVPKLGIGCAIADYDNDGDEDIAVTNATYGASGSAYGHQYMPGNTVRVFPPQFFRTDKTDGKYNFPHEGGVTLFRNEGFGKDGIPHFTDVTLESLLARGGNGTSAVWADVNNDGFVDLFVANYSDPDFFGFSAPYFAGQYNVLYRNNGDGTFSDVSAMAGIAGEAEFVYTPEGKKQYGWQSDQLDSSGRIIGDPAGNTLAAAFFDYDGDGLVDLITADDIPGRIRLYKNFGDFRFQEVSATNDFGSAGAWMGIAIGDINGDGTQDIFATNIGGPQGSRTRLLSEEETFMNDILNPPNKGSFYNGLWVYENGRFRNVAKNAAVDWGTWKPNIEWIPPEVPGRSKSVPMKPEGLEEGEFGFGTTLFDYDNDGDQDIAWIGSLRRKGAWPEGRIFGNPGRLLENLDAGRRFTDMAQARGVSNLSDKTNRATYQNGRGLAVGDFNNDGYYDLVMTNGGGFDSYDAPSLQGIGLQLSQIGIAREYRPGPTFLYISSAGTNNWLKIKLLGTQSNRDAIGAKIIIEYQEAGQTKKQVREIRAGESYASQNSLEQIFGIGTARTVDAMSIHWPSGKIQTLRNITSNQRLIIEED